jgi:hypothetical protein
MQAERKSLLAEALIFCSRGRQFSRESIPQLFEGSKFVEVFGESMETPRE